MKAAKVYCASGFSDGVVHMLEAMNIDVHSVHYGDADGVDVIQVSLDEPATDADRYRLAIDQHSATRAMITLKPIGEDDGAARQR